MYPYIELFGLQLSTYGISTAIGLILMGFIAYWLSRDMLIPYEDIVFGEITILVGAFLGAHLLYGLVEIPSMINYVNSYVIEPKFYHYIWYFLSDTLDGMVFYGGLLVGLLFGVIYCKIRKINVNDFSDCFAVGIPLFHVFGRIGCFLSGCCYGIESDFGFTATNAIVYSCNDVNRFPVQLLESALNLLLFGVMLLLFLKGIMRTNLIYVYLILYAIIRFCDEFLRGDLYRGIWLGLSTSQWISICTFTISIIILIIKSMKKRKGNLYEKV